MTPVTQPTDRDSWYFERNKTWHVEDSLWKSQQIIRMLTKNQLRPSSICEIGCGAAQILVNLRSFYDTSVRLVGYDTSAKAIEIAGSLIGEKHLDIELNCADFVGSCQDSFDLLLIIDVLEHIEDYLGFLRSIKKSGQYHLFHLPLDIHCSAVLRGTVGSARPSVGHLHFFTERLARETLEYAGYEVLDYVLTRGALELAESGRSFKRRLANGLRMTTELASASLAANLFGGYSILVLTR